ncbi:MAG TPA: hypothetical protein VKX28_26720 [Xanthobacteraceae bacterium]|nr:hypothetical protein [Xanthobacteraceae bacterium]
MTDLATVQSIYAGSNGEATKALYAELEKLGPAGIVAVNLFRACKCSERAKLYRGRGYKSEAYGRKDWSIGNLAAELEKHGAILGHRWGWGIDDYLLREGDPHHHVIYIDLPTGQVSFHNGTRYAGPDYGALWDGVKGASADRICRWVAQVVERAAAKAAGQMELL